MKNHASEVVSDEAFAKREERWSFDVPDTKEAYLIRDIFDGMFFLVWQHEQMLNQETNDTGLFPSGTAARTAVR
jgi:hypothetical protein